MFNFIAVKTTRSQWFAQCEENDCGEDIVADERYDAGNVAVSVSPIKTAGKGLFACSSIKRGVKIGYFGGEMMCTACVKRYKIGRSKKIIIRFHNV